MAKKKSPSSIYDKITITIMRLKTSTRIKVVHICVTDGGGAGLCCRKISKSLKEEGIDSQIISMLKFTNDKDVTRVKWGIKWFIYRVLNKFLLFLQLPLTDRVKVIKLQNKIKEPLSIPVSIFTSLHKHRLIQEADIIHLHSITGFIDYPTFFKNINKPIVWTLHDENIFNGLSHFSRTNIKNLKIDKKFYQIKLNSVSKPCDLGIVFLSKMMFNKFREHEMIKGRPKTIINNPVDTNIFHSIDKKEARIRLGLAQDAIVFIFVAAHIDDPWKGLNKLIKAVELLNMQNAIILAVGKKKDSVIRPSFMKAIGPIYDNKLLVSAYSAADYFISASDQEAFAQTPIEAMSCGIPAILTPVSGTQELITEKNGILCTDTTVEAILQGIKLALEKKYNPEEIRNDILARFSTKIIANKYIEFYKNILGQNNKTNILN